MRLASNWRPLVAFALGLSLPSGLIAARAFSAAQQASRQTWRYQCAFKVGPDAVRDWKLNSVGEKGWELVGLQYHPDRTGAELYDICFKQAQ